MTKNAKCEKCGETEQTQFYQGKKNICKTCLSEKNKEEKEKIQKLLEKASSPKVKTPRSAPSRESKLLESQELKINSLESQVSFLLSQYNELLLKLENLTKLIEEREEVRSIKIEEPVKVVIDNLPLPVSPVKRPASPKVLIETKKVRLSKSEKEKERIREVLENLDSYKAPELIGIIREFGFPIKNTERNITSYKRILTERLSK